jgi:hypothetical protein
MTTKISLYKVLPFTVDGVKVPGHEIATYQPEYQKSPIEFVVFEQFDVESGVTVQQLIQYQNFTKFLHRKSYSGTVNAVILKDGTRIHTEQISVAYHDGKGYLAAPMICRGVFRIMTLGKSGVLIEVAGVGAWARSKRDDAATALHLPCPWERDNKIYQEELAARLAIA